jgi:D-sedoheptulose 7-phosphate isomerase
MSMLEQRIQQQFFESADLHNQAAEALSRPVAQAAQALWGCITAGGKLLAAGSDVGVALAPVICAAFTGRFERERPPLAAVALRDEGVSPLAQQVRALGQPGDVLLAIDTAGVVGRAAARRGRRARARHDRALAPDGPMPAPGAERLTEADVLIAVPHDRGRARWPRRSCLVLHGLCDAVDLQLMGEQESA